MILITGANGQLGTELRYLLDERNLKYVATDVNELDITDEAQVLEQFKQIKPTIVFHCAAYTAVDKAEDEGKTLDYQINVTGTENIAKASEALKATLVYISTDYVFDGANRNGEYATDAETNPQNEYGRTKRLGEEAVEKYVSKHYIVRTSWVFGNYGHN
ncbi:MAG: NAD(P)-dependent oxidoreductase, partial [Streptococcaceae bacterium]|nr:NAD(P)-dependent oxidoreductase [Streptococcaceae bacterium]